VAGYSRSAFNDVDDGPVQAVDAVTCDPSTATSAAAATEAPIAASTTALLADAHPSGRMLFAAAYYFGPRVAFLGCWAIPRKCI
jgi:hypothetical protein